MNQKNVVKSLVDQFILNGKIPSTEDLQKQCSGIKMERFEHHGIKRSFDQVIENQKILQRGDMPEIGAFGQMKMELDENESADCDIEQFFLCKKKPKLNSYDNNSIEESKHQRNAVTLHSKDNGNNASTTDKLNGDHDQLKIVRYNCDKKCTLHARDNNPPFKCPLCPYSWPQECDRIAHIKAEHPTFNGPEVRSATCPAIKLLITETTNKISTPEESAINKLTPLQALGVRMAAYRNPTEWDSDLRRDAAKFRPQYWHSTDPFRLKIPFPDGISRHVSILPYSETDQKMKSIFDEDKIVDDDESGDGGDIEQFLLSNKKAKWNRTDNYSIEERTPKYDVDGLYLRENDKSFGSSDQLNQLKAPSYKCDECDYCSLEKCDLDDHVQKLHTAKIDPSAREHNFKCHLCDYTGYRNKQITRHLKAVHQEKNLKCHLCNFASTHEWDRIMHVKTTHPAMNGPKVRMLKDKEAALRALGVRMAAFRKHKQWDTSLRRDAAKFRPPDYDPNTTYNMKIPFPDGIVLSICIPAYTEDDANVESVNGESKITVDQYDSDGDIEQFFLCKKEANRNPYENNLIQGAEVVGLQLKLESNRCDVCDYCASKKCDLDNHLQEHHSKMEDTRTGAIHLEEKEFKCYLCKFSYNTKQGLVSHFSEFHPMEPIFKCNICHYKDLREDDIDIHIKTLHLKDINFKCHLCDFSSPQEIDRIAHFRAFHLKEIERDSSEYNKLLQDYLYCNAPSIDGPVLKFPSYCTIVSKRRKGPCQTALKRQRQEIRERKEMRNCLPGVETKNPELPKTAEFSRDHQVVLREQTANFEASHVTEKKCKFCSFITLCQFSLNNHVGTNHQQKFKCHLCESSSISKNDLMAHITGFHLMVTIFKCDLCDYKDLRVDDIDNHIKTLHLKDIKFKCHLCGFSSPHECDRIAHLRAFHLKEIESDSSEYSTRLRDYLCSNVPSIDGPVMQFPSYCTISTKTRKGPRLRANNRKRQEMRERREMRNRLAGIEEINPEMLNTVESAKEDQVVIRERIEIETSHKTAPEQDTLPEQEQTHSSSSQVV